MKTIRITRPDGRTYEVVADSSKEKEPLSSYVQVYRIRKDGTRGMKIDPYRNYAVVASAFAEVC